jgi:hypothetical protein
MMTLASHRSSTSWSLPALPILVIGWMVALAVMPNALHGKLPTGNALFAGASLLRMIPSTTVSASSQTVALLDDGSDSIDDDAADVRYEPMSDPSVKKIDPAADPMQDAQPLRVAHRSHTSARHMHHQSRTHRRLVRSHH